MNLHKFLPGLNVCKWLILYAFILHNQLQKRLTNPGILIKVNINIFGNQNSTDFLSRHDPAIGRSLSISKRMCFQLFPTWNWHCCITNTAWKFIVNCGHGIAEHTISHNKAILTHLNFQINTKRPMSTFLGFKNTFLNQKYNSFRAYSIDLLQFWHTRESKIRIQFFVKKNSRWPTHEAIFCIKSAFFIG